MVRKHEAASLIPYMESALSILASAGQFANMRGDTMNRLGYSVCLLTALLAATTMLQPGLHGSDEKTVTVVIENYEFIPKEVTVKVGTTVTWLNQDGAEHTATADDDSFDTDLLAYGESGSVTFSKPGSNEYYCDPHPFMTGTIVVE